MTQVDNKPVVICVHCCQIPIYFTDHHLWAMLTHTRCINLRRLPALTFIQHMYANSLTQITLARALAHLKQHGLFLEGENHTT